MWFEPLVWICISYVVISFGEHLIHKHLMHRKEIPQRFMPKQMWIYESHAVLHHGKYYKVFNHEPDEYGRFHNLHLEIMLNLVVFSPVWLTLMLFSRMGGSILLSMIILHHLCWNLIHEEMHVPTKTWLSSFPLYKRLARYHYLHHKYPTRNFNIVCPLADHIVRCVAKAKPEDLVKMKELNLT